MCLGETLYALMSKEALIVEKAFSSSWLICSTHRTGSLMQCLG